MKIKQANEIKEKRKKIISILEDKGLINLYNELSKDIQNELLYELETKHEKLKNMSCEQIRSETIIRTILDIKNNTKILENKALKDIKQVINTAYESDNLLNKDINKIRLVLLQNGYLYENYNLLDKDINKIHFINGNIYKIKLNNMILPVCNTLKNELDYYLNNNNCKYKKVITNYLDIIALTQNGDVRAVIFDYAMCIMPENYKNVEDIIFVSEGHNVEVPYIVKNGKKIPLNIQWNNN